MDFTIRHTFEKLRTVGGARQCPQCRTDALILLKRHVSPGTARRRDGDRVLRVRTLRVAVSVLAGDRSLEADLSVGSRQRAAGSGQQISLVRTASSALPAAS